MATLRSSPRDLSLKENRRHSRLLQQCHRSPSRSWVHSPDWCFQDEVARGAGCSNPDPIDSSLSLREPNVVIFNPVSSNRLEINSRVGIPANRVFSNRVPAALAEVGIKIDAIGFIPADGTVGYGVPIALAFNDAEDLRGLGHRLGS